LDRFLVGFESVEAPIGDPLKAAYHAGKNTWTDSTYEGLKLHR